MENSNQPRNKRVVFYVGKFSKTGAWQNKFSSAAGDLVQGQIISELKTLSPHQVTRYIAMEPNRIWPGSGLHIKGAKECGGEFISYINLPLIKNIIFATKIFGQCLRHKPDIVIQYNSYLFENIAILLYARLSGAKTCQILQDIRIGREFTWLARQHDKIANLSLKRFDYVLPITEAISKKLGLDKHKYQVFSGGITNRGFELLGSAAKTVNIAVFAGALERHNGIDKLISFWTNRFPELDLHIFGRGSLTSTVLRACDINPRLIYHGFLPQEEIMKWQKIAKFNFCLRYSDGIQEEYFFPSKFFDIACAPGLLIVNNFKNLPPFMKECGGVIDTMDAIEKYVLLPDEDLNKISTCRRDAVLQNSSWHTVLKRIVDRLSGRIC